MRSPSARTAPGSPPAARSPPDRPPAPRQHARRAHGLRPHRRPRRARQRQQPCQPRAALAQIPPQPPEPFQRARQPQPPLHLPAGLTTPRQRRPQVSVLRLQPRQPADLRGAVQLRLGRLGQRQVVGRVRAASVAAAPLCLEPLQRVGADRSPACVQPRRAVGPGVELQQALVDQRGDRRPAPSAAARRLQRHTASAASSVQPPTNTASRANSVCAAASSSP